MALPSNLESLSTTASSNGPAGSDARTLADDGLRLAYAFIAQAIQVGADIASSTTITPPSTGSSFHVTGTTAITTIASTNSWNGRLIALVFDGALTFTHGTNLALPGSVNITTAANDVALMRQNAAGAWRCIHYQRADGTFPTTAYLPLAGGTVSGAATFNGDVTLGNASSDSVTVNATTTLLGEAGSVIENIVGQLLLKNVTGDSGGLKIYSDVNGDAYLIETFAGNMFLATNNQAKIGITSDGRVYGLYLHNNAGALTGTTNQYIASGTYTPTLTAVANISSTSGPAGQWMRVGNVVTVSGQFRADPTTNGVVTTLGISLPIASDFTDIAQCSGTATGFNGSDEMQHGGISADTTNNRINLDWIELALGADNLWAFQCTYVVV